MCYKLRAVLKLRVATLKRRNASKGAELMRFEPQLWDMSLLNLIATTGDRRHQKKTQRISAPSGLTEFYDIVFSGSRRATTCEPNKMWRALKKSCFSPESTRKERSEVANWFHFHANQSNNKSGSQNWSFIKSKCSIRQANRDNHPQEHSVDKLSVRLRRSIRGFGFRDPEIQWSSADIWHASAAPTNEAQTSAIAATVGCMQIGAASEKLENW